MSRYDFQTRVCLAPHMLRAAAELRYEDYISKGFITENKSKVFVDVYDSYPSSLTFGLYLNERMVATMRACIYWPERNWSDIPAVLKYDSSFKTWAASRPVVVEWSRFAVAASLGESSIMEVELCLLSAVPFLAQFFVSPGFIAAVREKHTRFYRRFGYEPISDARTADFLTFESVLMAMDWLPHRDRIKSNKFFSRCFQCMPRLEDLSEEDRELFESRLPIR